MSAIAEWFGIGGPAKAPAEVELEGRGEVGMGDDEHQEGHAPAPPADEQLLPTLTDEQAELLKFERAKQVRRQQVRIHHSRVDLRRKRWLFFTRGRLCFERSGPRESERESAD